MGLQRQQLQHGVATRRRLCHNLLLGRLRQVVRLYADLAVECLAVGASNAHHLGEADWIGIARLLLNQVVLKVAVHVVLFEAVCRVFRAVADRLLLDVGREEQSRFTRAILQVPVLQVVRKLHVRVVPHSDWFLHGHVQDVLILIKNVDRLHACVCARRGLKLLAVRAKTSSSSYVLDLHNWPLIDLREGWIEFTREASLLRSRF